MCSSLMLGERFLNCRGLEEMSLIVQLHNSMILPHLKDIHLSQGWGQKNGTGVLLFFASPTPGWLRGRRVKPFGGSTGFGIQKVAILLLLT